MGDLGGDGFQKQRVLNSLLLYSDKTSFFHRNLEVAQVNLKEIFSCYV